MTSTFPICIDTERSSCGLVSWETREESTGPDSILSRILGRQSRSVPWRAVTHSLTRAVLMPHVEPSVPLASASGSPSDALAARVDEPRAARTSDSDPYHPRPLGA